MPRVFGDGLTSHVSAQISLMKIFALTMLLGALAAAHAIADEAKPFDQKFTLLGVTFHVQAKGDSVVITPAGLAEDNRLVSHELKAEIIRAEVADLNVDGSPEIYIYLRQPGAEQRGMLLAYSANRKKSMSDIFLPDLAEVPGAMKDYVGKDEFAIVESAFVRRFPIPGGKWRQFQYKLKPGEAGWLLELDKMLEF
jgi:hypothetical protein